MASFTRLEIAEILELDETFVVELERESILYVDVATGDTAFSPRMLERARVAHSLVDELGVNLAGVAVILRLREDLGQLRTNVRTLAKWMEERGVLPD